MPGLLSVLSDLEFAGGEKIANLEMETAGIYGLANCHGHNALSFNVILANRSTNQFSNNPEVVMDNFIEAILTELSSI